MLEKLFDTTLDNAYVDGEVYEVNVSAVRRNYDLEGIDRGNVLIQQFDPDTPEDGEEGYTQSIAFNTEASYRAFVDALLDAGAKAFDYDPRGALLEATLEAPETGPVVNNFFGSDDLDPEAVMEAWCAAMGITVEDWNLIGQGIAKVMETEALVRAAQDDGLAPVYLNEGAAAEFAKLLGARADLLGLDPDGELESSLTLEPPQPTDPAQTEFPIDLDSEGVRETIEHEIAAAGAIDPEFFDRLQGREGPGYTAEVTFTLSNVVFGGKDDDEEEVIENGLELTDEPYEVDPERYQRNTGDGPTP